MPIKWDKPGSKPNFVIICQKAVSIGKSGEIYSHLAPGRWPDSRFLALFIAGEFSLDEANNFVVESLDNDVIPEARDFFSLHEVEIMTVAVSAHNMPPRMANLINNFSCLEFIDEYLFYLVKHEIDHFCASLKAAEDKDIRRMKQRRRDRRRLGLPADLKR